MVCCCAVEDSGLRVYKAKFRSSGHKHRHTATECRATWLFQSRKAVTLGITYLSCHLPGGHNRRKDGRGEHPRWHRAPVPPLPAAIAVPLPHQHGPVSGPRTGVKISLRHVGLCKGNAPSQQNTMDSYSHTGLNLNSVSLAAHY